MKTVGFWGATAAVITLASPANSADMPNPIYAKAPLAQTWTGFYAGVNVGGGISTNSLTNAQAPTQVGDSPALGITVTSGNTNGAVGGVQVGYNFQNGPVVYGIEGEFDGSSLQGHNLYRSFGASGDVNIKTNWIATVTGRIGAMFHNDTLLYAKGGVAFDNNSFSITAQNPFSSGAYPKTSETRVGWTMGFGAEYMIGSNWTAKLEYDYLDFGGKNLAFATGTDTNSFTTTAAFSATSNQQMHTVKAGLNYKLY
ncbi:MAG: porin family protein [Bradyrhizobiaceae bacterium]|nr:MAG: porin family protein [Bradyrhizobiaceae bacterium]